MVSLAARMQIPFPQLSGVEKLSWVNLTASDYWQIPSPQLWATQDLYNVVAAPSLQHPFLLPAPTTPQTHTNTHIGRVRAGKLVKTEFTVSPAPALQCQQCCSTLQPSSASVQWKSGASPKAGNTLLLPQGVVLFGSDCYKV